MSAEFKSHILRREEKGAFGVPLKRMLLSAVVGGLGYTVVQMAARGSAVPVGIAVTLAVLILTGTRGGLPLWQRVLYHLRGALLLAAARSPHSLMAKLAEPLDLPTELARLEGRALFVMGEEGEVDLREWVTFAQSDERDGLRFVDAPMQRGDDG